LLASLKTGEVHFYWQLPPRLFGALQFDKNANAVLSAFSTTHFYFNFEHTRTTEDNVFGDIRARRALLLALDKQQIVEVGWGTTAAPILTNQFLPSNFPLAGKGFPDIERDVEEAKRLFAEVGITELHFNSWDAPAWTPVSEVIQQNLAEAGVETILHVSRVADWSCAMGRGDCGPDWKWPNMIGVNGAVDPPDPSLHISPQWICPGTWSGGKYCNEEMDRIGSLALQTTDMAERARLYEQWEQIFIEDLPAVSWALTALYDGRHKSLKGVINLFGVPFYEAAWLDN
jgi:ABC-type transport system substrate-binding protein